MFEDKSNSKFNQSFKNHIRHIHSKSSGFSRGYKGRMLKPVMEHSVTGQVNKNMMKGISGYEQIRNKVMETAETPIQHVNQVKSGIKKTKVSIGL
jgi:hypothetical protein